MRNYIICVRVEMRDNDSGEIVTYDDFAHRFPATGRLDGGCDDYRTITDSVTDAINDLEVRYEAAENESEEPK